MDGMRNAALSVGRTSLLPVGRSFVHAGRRPMTRHITLDPLHSGGPGQNGVPILHGGFKAKAVVWFSDIPGTPGNPLVTAKVVEVRDLTNAKANLSHLPEAEQEVLSMMRMPIQMDGQWSYGVLSDYHKGKSLYAIDLNHPNDNQATVYSPGHARVLKADIKSGSVSLLVNDRLEIHILHLDHILEGKTLIPYKGFAEVIEEKNMKQTFASQIAEYNATHDDLNQTEEFVNFFKTVPEAWAMLSEADTIMSTVQSAIDNLIAQGLTLQDMEAFAQGGNEGKSDGSHVHFDVFDQLMGKAVPLFGFAHAYQNGIKAVVRFDIVGSEQSKDVDMWYDASLNTLKNPAEGIAMTRQQAGEVAENVAYAIEAGVIGRKLERRFATYVDDDGQLKNEDIWTAMNNGELQRWNGNAFVPFFP